MRIIVWGINYAPEFTGIAPHSVALCEFLHARGHDVEMKVASWMMRFSGDTRSGTKCQQRCTGTPLTMSVR